VFGANAFGWPYFGQAQTDLSATPPTPGFRPDLELILLLNRTVNLNVGLQTAQTSTVELNDDIAFTRDFTRNWN
jgi:hypothetical protein